MIAEHVQALGSALAFQDILEIVADKVSASYHIASNNERYLTLQTLLSVLMGTTEAVSKSAPTLLEVSHAAVEVGIPSTPTKELVMVRSELESCMSFLTVKL